MNKGAFNWIGCLKTANQESEFEKIKADFQNTCSSNFLLSRLSIKLQVFHDRLCLLTPEFRDGVNQQAKELMSRVGMGFLDQAISQVRSYTNDAEGFHDAVLNAVEVINFLKERDLLPQNLCLYFQALERVAKDVSIEVSKAIEKKLSGGTDLAQVSQDISYLVRAINEVVTKDYLDMEPIDNLIKSLCVEAHKQLEETINSFKSSVAGFTSNNQIEKIIHLFRTWGENDYLMRASQLEDIVNMYEDNDDRSVNTAQGMLAAYTISCLDSAIRSPEGSRAAIAYGVNRLVDAFYEFCDRHIHRIDSDDFRNARFYIGVQFLYLDQELRDEVHKLGKMQSVWIKAVNGLPFGLSSAYFLTARQRGIANSLK